MPICSWSFRLSSSTLRRTSQSAFGRPLAGLALVAAAASVAGASDCCEVHKDVGCNDPGCTVSVCTYDPACCDRGWDHLCADAARHLCATVCDDGCNSLCEGDLDESNSVDARDLTMLLSDWHALGRCSDLDGNGVTGPEDIAYLIAVWGPC